MFDSAVAANRAEASAESEQKEHTESKRGGGFHGPADGHLRTHDQGGGPDRGRISEKDASYPAVESRTPLSQARDKLKRSENHKYQPGKDMLQREQAMAGEAGIEVHGGRPQAQQPPGATAIRIRDKNATPTQSARRISCLAAQ